MDDPTVSASKTTHEQPSNSSHLIADRIFDVLTFSYSAAFKHHTRNPINHITENQDYWAHKDAVIKALARFRQTKSEELKFVQGAAALCGGAVIGVFSWPSTERTVWAAKMLWNWSLFLSTFALISSAHQRLLRYLPEKDDEPFDERRLIEALSLFLRPPVPRGNNTFGRRRSNKMLWFWQCPIMLMNYSWVLFLLGYTLHLLTPVFDPSQAEMSLTAAIITVCGCGLVVINFVFCAGICQHRLLRAQNWRSKGIPRAPMV
ncbi:hypothetical protein BKA67DRAFT_542100 [Truncatella angustata]|uniref:Uncharacterized protein n=1 Tax=Truncatella angustata TaxID=152316 RepID=A0A9P8RFL8_9PEZI|nr:uncharacterized protein BKA67DRAFT_542100 [Truncatella angustata]KAH6645123.1 hypothetical protein BKA67DRAFT_542100 [Truncatella angustata]